MYEILNELLPKEIKGTFTQCLLTNDELSYGFHCDTELAVASETGFSKAVRKGHWQGNRVSLFGNFEGKLINDTGLLDGINNAYFGADMGVFNQRQYMDDFIRTSANKADAMQVQAAIISRVHSKNMIAPLYNMLCLYYALGLEHDISYDPGSRVYDDGHVFIENKQLYGDACNKFKGKGFNHFKLVGKVEFVKAFDNELHKVNGTRPVLDVETTQAILYFESVDANDLKILDYAFSGWQALTPLGLVHTRPCCAKRVGINTFNLLPRYDHDLAIKQHQVMGLLTRLIRHNRLEADFYAAYGMLCSVFINPKPRTAESAAWLSKLLPVSMPQVDFVHGADPHNLLGGTAYHSSAEVFQCFEAWKAVPGLAVHHSMLLNEAAYVQLAVLYRVSQTTLITWKNYVNKLTEGNCINDSGLIADCALLSLASGTKTTFPFRTQAGVGRCFNTHKSMIVEVKATMIDPDAPSFYNFTPDEASYTSNEIIEYEDIPIDNEVKELLIQRGFSVAEVNLLTKKKEKKRTIKKDLAAEAAGLIYVTSLPPLMYPVFTYGVNTAVYLGADFAGEAKAIFNDADGCDAVFEGVDSLARFMDIARVIGWNVKATDTKTGKQYTNWADNSSGRFVITELCNSSTTIFRVNIQDITERRKCWISVPHLIGKVTLSYKNQSRMYKLYNGHVDDVKGVHSKLVQFGGGYIQLEAIKALARENSDLSGLTTGVVFKPAQILDDMGFRRAMRTLPLTSVKTQPSSHARGGVELVVEEENDNQIVPCLDLPGLDLNV